MGINWFDGYMSKCYATFVDEQSWLDGYSPINDIGANNLEIISGSIKHSNSDDLRESATIECLEYDTTVERWIRIWMDVKQDSNYAHEAIFTGLAISPGKQYDGLYQQNTVDCYSVLKPAQDILLKPGWYAPIGAKGADLAKELLSVIPAPVYIDTDSESPRLEDSLIAESGENHLSMALAILNSIYWKLRINGMGEVYLEPIEENPSPVITMDSTYGDIIEPQITIDYDWYECPNVFRAVTQDGIVAEARDESDDSIFSIQNRGREVWAEENDITLGDNESLGKYAMRRLEELQRVNTLISYDRRFYPDLNVGDRVIINYPANKISGIFLITSQNIELGYNAKTSEEAIQVWVQA